MINTEDLQKEVEELLKEETTKTINHWLNNSRSNSFAHEMKMMGFVDDVDCFTRGFTRIYVSDDKLQIGHTVSKKRTDIQYNDLTKWIAYFDRI